MHRRREDPDYATQKHSDHMDALVTATRTAIDAARVDGASIEAIAIDTTGSTRRARWRETATARRLLSLVRSPRPGAKPPKSPRPHGTQSSPRSTGAAESTPPNGALRKLLHWLRHNPEKRDRMATALEHCDMAAATLCGITDPQRLTSSICAMGHKWMWNESLGGLPSGCLSGASRPAARRRSRQARRPIRHVGTHRGASVRGMGGQARAAAGHPDSRRRLRCPLGRHRRRSSNRRRRQRGRHLHLHHGHQRRSRTDPRRLRRRPRIHSSKLHGHRSGAVGHRRHLRSHRPPSQHTVVGLCQRHRKLPHRRDRPTAAHLG